MARKTITIFNKYYNNDLKNLVKSLTNNSKRVSYPETTGDIKYVSSGIADYYAAINAVGNVTDVQEFFEKLRRNCAKNTRIIVVYYNYLWEPFIKLAEFLGFKKKQKEQNWLTLDDVANILELADFDIIQKGSRLLFPFDVPFISYLLNRYAAKLPFINKLCLTNYIVARPTGFPDGKRYSVSVIIPARNEEGTIPVIINRLPKMGRQTEVIFVEGHSTDKTWEKITEEKNKYSNIKVSALVQKGKGKADAVRMGISKAKGDIIMILDADLSVPPQDLSKFYNVLSSGRGEFVNGSRLVYPLEKESMRFLNQIGNKLFSLVFSWILKQRFTDTLCGTKAFFRSDYERMMSFRNIFGDFDPFGDYELIFGATKLNLKIVEVPVHYKSRVYGKSNISRFVHGWLLVKMCLFAVKKFKLDD
jgi:hypothetical protein